MVTKPTPPTPRMAVDSAAVWKAFHEGLARFLRNRVGPDDADDILQDVFLRVHRSLDRGVVPRDLSGWVHQIARNAVIDHYRRAGADPTVREPGIEDHRTLDAFDEPSALEELAHCVRPMVDGLPTPYREAISMTAFDGLTQADAARTAGVSISGMKSRVQRGRKLLASRLHDCCVLEFDARGGLMDYCEGGTC